MSEEIDNNLEEMLGKEKAEKLVRLCNNYSSYIKRYKKAVNEILNSHGHELLLAHSFIESDYKKEFLKEALNGNANEISTVT